MLCAILWVVQPDIHLPETSHDCGRLPLLWTATWNMEVINLGNGYLSVRNVASTNPVFSVDRVHFFVPPDSGTVEVEVSFTPTNVGIEVGSLEITTNDSDEPFVLVSVQGEGLAPESAKDPFQRQSSRSVEHDLCRTVLSR